MRHFEFYSYSKVWFNEFGWGFNLLDIIGLSYAKEHKAIMFNLLGFSLAWYDEDSLFNREVIK